VATRIVRRNVNQARYCYEVELARSPALAGNTTFALVVAPTGSVTGVTTSSSTLGNATAESCIQRALQRLTFTSGATESRLAVTFTFQPATATPPAAAAPPAAPAP
jgi:hypothetical protein